MSLIKGQSTKIKLIANGSRKWQRWIGRWGLSFLIDDDILFDAFGDARVLMGNLRRFKINIGKIKNVAVSHEHWDHVDGLRPFLVKRPQITVWLPHSADQILKDKIRLWGGDIVDVKEPIKLKDGVYLSGEIMGRYKGKAMPEQAMVLETVKGLIVIAGCAHPGIATIVDHVKGVFHKPVYGVIGGFHLKNKSLADINVEAMRLKATGVDMVAPLHCTGAKAENIFLQVFGSSCFLLREGQEMDLG
jgi:7,8-dihydropterin-6-yl-methyl-4-(beta-D-ribofuranosyl)aminobenzene 5'-phosphate synthase